MTVSELIEMLQEYDPGTNVKIAYQPHWPMATDADFVKKASDRNRYGIETESVYICQSGFGGNEYAPGSIYRDDEEDDENEE